MFMYGLRGFKFVFDRPKGVFCIFIILLNIILCFHGRNEGCLVCL